MNRLFFLGSILPPLKAGSEPGILFEDLLLLLKGNLSASSLEKVKALRSYIDLKNVEQLLKKGEIDPRGNYTEKELEESFVNQEGLPSYLFEHLEGSDQEDDQLRHFSKVYIRFFKEMAKKHRGFMKWYFNFEREWRILLAGYRAKKLGVDPATALQHEDVHDTLVAQILAQKDAPFFEFPFEYEELGESLKEVQGDPKAQYLEMAKYRFKKIEEKTLDAPFSEAYLLGFVIKLMIVEDVWALDVRQGHEKLQELVKGNV